MKRISALFFGLGGLGVLVWLVIISPALPVRAIEPTVTPQATSPAPPPDPAETLCHLRAGEDCTMVGELDLAAMTAKSWLNPQPEAQEVPTTTLVSLTFAEDIDPDTLHPGSFYVTQGVQRMAGTIRYLPLGRMAVFSPAAPLSPASRYTATVTTAVRNPDGEPIPQSRSWSFTTIPAREIGALAATAGAGMNFYFGDLHSHTGYSDGVGSPADAYFMARASGVDFFAVSEHGFMMSEAEWQDVKAQAQAATENEVFVALPAFEYSHKYGHINVFGSEVAISRDDPRYDTLAKFYAWLVEQPTAFGQFNHPKVNEQVDWNFNDFAFNPAADQKIVLQELETADQYFLSLNQGWHLGTLKNHDTHLPDWGCCPLMGVVAPSLTPDSILAALRARRTFFVSPSDSNFGLSLQANNTWMGSAIPFSPQVTFTITAHDPDPTGGSLRMRLYDNGLMVAETDLPSASTYTWNQTLPVSLGHYYYAEAFSANWLFPAYSSPIWVERPPLAEAGTDQIVAPGMVVMLDGQQSSDPDGQVLAYQWTQESGSPVSLAASGSSHPTFIAPNALGPLTFRLTVTDTGSLIASDTTTITVTAQPILSISKVGPRYANPGDPITYVLTVVNSGINDATDVLVTDVIPQGANYVSGGIQQGKNVIWTIPTIPANGGSAQVSFVVTIPTKRSLVNRTYGATCSNCIDAVGQVAVFTNDQVLYLPLIRK